MPVLIWCAGGPWNGSVGSAYLKYDEAYRGAPTVCLVRGGGMGYEEAVGLRLTCANGEGRRQHGPREDSVIGEGVA